MFQVCDALGCTYAPGAVVLEPWRCNRVAQPLPAAFVLEPEAPRADSRAISAVATETEQAGAVQAEPQP